MRSSPPENRGPSRDWLKIVKTSEAKNKIRNWFKKMRREENIQEGRDALDRELRRNLMTLTDEQDDFTAAAGPPQPLQQRRGDVRGHRLRRHQIPALPTKAQGRIHKAEERAKPKPATVDLKRVHSSDGVVVEGIDNCPIKFAKCCSPLPGDDIIGFVTRGFGVSIHKRDCANASRDEGTPRTQPAGSAPTGPTADKENYKATLGYCRMDRANLLRTWHWHWAICACRSTL